MNQKLILNVEDDLRLLKMNKMIFEEEGFPVENAVTLAEARAFIRRKKPDAVVLDRGLPDGDGLDFLRELRELRETAQIPVLMLTGYKEDADASSGYDNGCDDYVTKPVSSGLLLKKLKRLLKNTERVPESISRGPLTLKPFLMEAAVNGMDLRLTPNEYKLLQFFVQNENLLMNAEYIYRSVWGRSMGRDVNALKKTIHTLRKKLRGSGFTISNEYGGEYLFEHGEP